MGVHGSNKGQLVEAGFLHLLYFGAPHAGNEKWNDPYEPLLVVSFEGTAGFIPTFPTEHKQV